MSHGDGLDELSAALKADGVEHTLYHDCIHIPLRDTEGHVEVKAWSGKPHSVSLTVRDHWMDLGKINDDLAVRPQLVARRLQLQMRQNGVEPVNLKDGAA